MKIFKKKSKSILFFLLAFFILNTLLFVDASSQNSEEEITFLVFGHVYDDYDALKLSVPLIGKESPNFIVFLGDSIDSGQNKTWKEFNSIMGGVDVPIYFAPGNHDLEALTDEEYFKKELSISNSLFQEFNIKNNTFIILNTISKDKPYYGISDEQFNFINRIYERDDTNKIIFVHHELFYKDNGELGGTKNPNSMWNEKIVQVIKNETLAVFSGNGGDEPYFSYIEEDILYLGVRFSKDPIKIPPHMLKASISKGEMTVEPIPLKQDLTKVPYNKIIEKIKENETFRSKIKLFIIKNLKFVLLSIIFIINLLILVILVLIKKINKS